MATTPTDAPDSDADPRGPLDLGHHEEWGAGEPVLLLHGGYCSLEAVRDLGDALAVRYRVLAPERTGHGRTPDRDGPYSYGRWVDDVLAYLDALGVGPVHVVGHSDGGILGLLLARDHPARVRSLTAIGANIGTDAWVPDDYPYVTVPDEAFAVLTEEYGRLSPDGADHSETVLAKLAALWTTEPDIPAASLARVTAPTLVMAGEHDMVAPAHTESIARAVPGATVTVVPGTTHLVVRERPDLVAAAVLRHLARSAGR
ncbi:MAG TPA: alpha/beta hydrolase [Cellulomonas sp.]